MKRTCRSLVSLLLIVVLSFALVGCGQNSETPAASQAETTTDGAAVEHEPYPTKEIRLIIPWSVGGGNDTAARIIAPYMEKELGVSIVIDNQGGGAGLVGTNLLAVAEPDGYTIGVFSSPSTPDLTFLQNETSWSLDSFEFLGAFNSEPQCIIVNGSSPYTTLQELVDASKASDAPLNVGATGPISVSAIVAQQLIEGAGANLNFVPFDGTSETITALYGGHIDVAIRPGDRYAAEHEDGQLRILAVASNERLSSLPDVPTVEEAVGVKSEVFSFRGWWAPAGIEDYRWEILCTAFENAMNNPECQQKITESVAQFDYTPGTELKGMLSDSINRWREVMPSLEAMVQ